MDEELFNYYREREEHTTELAAMQIDEQAVLDQTDENEDPALISWNNLNGNDERCHVMTGFTCDQFLRLFDLCENSIPENVGRGRKSRVSKQDKLLIVLCYVKHYETVDKLKQTFNVSKSQLHRIIDETVSSITPILFLFK